MIRSNNMKNENVVKNYSLFDDNTLDIIKKSFEYTTKHYKLSKVGTESILYIMFKG